ncbi:PstS family phosphate ABC transporter substrate-binding protein [Streptomyces sp. NPDC015130]|uniref:PstS family phosphate ABC transporter substrate-binding protein n=1 Tax=Streptomyces sp. NPDC015130 TaxID=3364940 RepID=UPI0037016B37
MEWITAENVIAVGTALIGVLVTLAVVWIDRFSPQRKRLAYRVQLNTPLHREGTDQDGEIQTVRAGDMSGVSGVSSPADGSTLVLLRIENHGDLDIETEAYGHAIDPNGLRVTFGTYTDPPDGENVDVQGVVATIPPGQGHIRTALEGGGQADDPKLRFERNMVVVPKVPLARGQYFKLLVQLSRPVTDGNIKIIGGLTNGDPQRNRSTTFDDKQPRFSSTVRSVTIVLATCVVALAAIIVREQTPPPIGCATGTLTVTGSTAFAPALRDIEKAYEKDCEGSDVIVDVHGSTAGIRKLAEIGAKTSKGTPAVVALSDGRKPGGYPELRENMVAASLFTLVLNDGIPLDDLSLDEVRRIYQGEITNWKQLVPGLDRPVLLVSRDANSGTRQVFQRRVLDRNEPANSSQNCQTLDDHRAKVIRCELDSTEQVLTTVAKLPGAIGYSELRASEGRKGMHKVAVDGRLAVVEELGESSYPYREIEYAYTWGVPPAGSLTASFLTYLSRGGGQDVIRTHGHLPCATPKGLRICGDA